MSEYWKSIPRKFCEFCKCWLTDNRASIDFHEKGKRHKENVELKLKEIRKKSLQDSREKDFQDREMAKMEKAALEAFKNDLKNDPELAKKYGVSLEPKPKPYPEEGTSGAMTEQEAKAKAKKRKAEVKEWYEAKSDEGYSYYWHITTGETKWEAPDVYLSIEEQEKITAKEKEDEESKAKEQPVKTHEDPKFSRSAFGAWSVVKEEKQAEIYDETSAAPEPEDIPLPPGVDAEVKPKPKKDKFKEKTVESLEGGNSMASGPVAFKKRKVASGARNVRQRNHDD